VTPAPQPTRTPQPTATPTSQPTATPKPTPTPEPTPARPPAGPPGDNGNHGPKPDKPKPPHEKPDKPKPPHEKPDKPKPPKTEPDKPKPPKPPKPNHPVKETADKHDGGEHGGGGKDQGKDHGSVPAPLAVGLPGWLAIVRRRLAALLATAGARIRWTARIRQKAKGGLSGPPRGGIGATRRSVTCPGDRSAAVWWRTRPGYCAPAGSTCIRHPT
jgi:hypothetical protein